MWTFTIFPPEIKDSFETSTNLQKGSLGSLCLFYTIERLHEGLLLKYTLLYTHTHTKDQKFGAILWI